MAIEGEDGAFGSAADLLGGDSGASGGGDGNGGDGSQADPNGGGDGNGGGDNGVADPDWYANLSAEADGDNPSTRDWVKGLGVKDLDGLAKIARDNQKALRDSGRIKVPGEGAKPEEIAEFRKAIGVPDDAKGYVFAAPKDADGNDVPLDNDLLGRVAESAHKHGLPKGPLEAVVADFIQAQLDKAADADRQQQDNAKAVLKSWGKDSEAKLAAVDNAARVLGLSRDDMIAARNAWGAEKALTIFARLGEGLAEDKLITGESKRFGISGAEAKAEIARLKTDEEFQKKLMSGEAAAVARWNRLNEAEAAYEEAQRKAA